MRYFKDGRLLDILISESKLLGLLNNYQMYRYMDSKNEEINLKQSKDCIFILCTAPWFLFFLLFTCNALNFMTFFSSPFLLLFFHLSLTTLSATTPSPPTCKPFFSYEFFLPIMIAWRRKSPGAQCCILSPIYGTGGMTHTTALLQWGSPVC